MKFLASLLPSNPGESKKAQVLVLVGALILFGKHLGFSQEELKSVLYIGMTYLTGQGLADLGKEGKTTIKVDKKSTQKG